jgi:hypothetical protein
MILRTPIDEDRRSGLHVTDDREPTRFYDLDFHRDHAHPLARGIPASVPEHRHVFDALVAYGKETELESPHDDADDDPNPFSTRPVPTHQEFRLNLTCVQCGQIVALQGVLTADETHKRVDPVPLRTKTLQAQHTSTYGSYVDYSCWAVHDPQGMLVGAMRTGSTARGRTYVEGYILADAGQPLSVQAPTAIGALRKLAALYKPAA